MNNSDLFKKLPLINECMLVGGGIGRRPKMKSDHLKAIIDLIDSLLKDININETPTVEHMKSLVKASQMIGRVRNQLMEKKEKI